MMNKKILKKSPEELEQYLQFRRRGSRVEAKKGRGYKYKRAQIKREMRENDES